MKGRRHTPEEAIEKLKEGERLLGEGMHLPDVLEQLEITQSTWSRWKNTHGPKAGVGISPVVHVTIEPNVAAPKPAEVEEPTEQVLVEESGKAALVEKQEEPALLEEPGEPVLVDEPEEPTLLEEPEESVLPEEPELPEVEPETSPTELYSEREPAWSAAVAAAAGSPSETLSDPPPPADLVWSAQAPGPPPQQPSPLQPEWKPLSPTPSQWSVEPDALDSVPKSEFAFDELAIPSQQVEIREINPLTPLRRQSLIVVAFVLIFVAMGALYARQMTPRFTASAGLVVEDTRRATLFVAARPLDAERYIADQIAVLTSRAVAEKASDLAPTLEPGANIPVEDLIADVSVSSDLRTDFLTVTFEAGDPLTAQVGANAIGRAYQQVVEARLEQDATDAVAKLDDAIESTVSQIVDIQADLESTQASGVDRQLLEQQMSAIVAELAAIRNGAETPDDIRAKADQLAAELQARLLLTEVEDSDPGVTLLRRRLEDALTLLSELTLSRSQLEVDAQLAGNGVALFSAAGPGTRVGGSLASVLAVSVVMGGLVGTGAAYWLNDRKGRVSNRALLERLVGTPFLGEIPKLDSHVVDAEMIVEALPGSKGADAFHRLVEEIQRELKEGRKEPEIAYLGGPDQGVILTVVSPGFQEGKTMVAVNLALAASRAGLRSLVVDGDYQTQRASTVLGPFTTGGQAGLADVLNGKANLNEVLSPISLGGRYAIDLLRRGENNPSWADLRNSSTVQRIFNSLKSQFDLIIVDTAPVLHVPPARAAIKRADYALAVVRHRDHVDSVEELLIRLNLLGVPTLGYVYTHLPAAKPA